MALTHIFLFFGVKSALLSAVVGDLNEQLAGNDYCLLRRKNNNKKTMKEHERKIKQDKT